MGLYDGIYGNIRPRLADWLNAIGGEVQDLPLDLCNRAREKLWKEADWEPLIKRVDLTVDANLQAQLPADFGKVINVNFDPLGYKKPIGYFYKDGDLVYGYEIQYQYNDTTGFTTPILQFFFALPYTPRLYYKRTLAKLTTAGGDNQPLFFPEELVLRCAQFIHISESGLGNSEYQILEREYFKELLEYKSHVQGVNEDQRNDIKDDAGNKVRIRQIDAQGGTVAPRAISPSLDPKYGV